MWLLSSGTHTPTFQSGLENADSEEKSAPWYSHTYTNMSTSVHKCTYIHEYRSTLASVRVCSWDLELTEKVRRLVSQPYMGAVDAGAGPHGGTENMQHLNKLYSLNLDVLLLCFSDGISRIKIIIISTSQVVI